MSVCCQMLRHWVHRRRWSRYVRRFTRRWMNTASSSIPTSPAVLPSSCCDSRLCAASASSVPITSLRRSSLVTWALNLFYLMPWKTQVQLFSCVGMVNRLGTSSQNIGRTTVLVDLWLLSVRCWQHWMCGHVSFLFGCCQFTYFPGWFGKYFVSWLTSIARPSRVTWRSVHILHH